MVFTQPDRPRGRGQKMAPSPVKKVAMESGIPLYQPEKFNTEPTWEILEREQFDLAVVVAYSAKIGKRALEGLPKGWLNLHPSLLPKYRGAAPMQWALINGETTTGISSFFLNEDWDAGPICLQETLKIGEEDDYGTLSQRCAAKGAELILRSLELISEGKEPRIPQDDKEATFARLLKKEDLYIDWTQSARDIRNRIRGLTPQPGARTIWEKGLMRIRKAVVLDDRTPGTSPPGLILQMEADGIDIQTGKGVLRILELQPENKKPMSTKDFLNGYSVKVGSQWGFRSQGH